jgi:hypothetical protein
MNQSANLRLDSDDTKSVKFGIKFGEGCCLPRVLLNLYGSYFTKESLEVFADVKI